MKFIIRNWNEISKCERKLRLLFKITKQRLTHPAIIQSGILIFTYRSSLHLKPTQLPVISLVLLESDHLQAVTPKNHSRRKILPSHSSIPSFNFMRSIFHTMIYSLNRSCASISATNISGLLSTMRQPRNIK